jgi:intracellular septation protein
MKLFFDFLPLILFFGTFKVAEGRAESAARWASENLGFMVSGGTIGPNEAPVLLATIVVIVATLLQIGFLVLTRRKVDTMLWITFAIVTVLGGATVWFHDPTFIKWKPSVLYWAAALAFWISDAFFGKNLVRAALKEQLHMPAAVWQRLNVAWIAFFAVTGFVNLYVAYSYSTSTWASFKVFGITGAMFLFMVAQGFYISRYLKDEVPVPAEPDSR